MEIMWYNACLKLPYKFVWGDVKVIQHGLTRLSHISSLYVAICPTTVCSFKQKNRYLTCKIFILASGKKILEYIWKCQNMIPQYNWTFGTGFMRPFINPNYLVSKIILIEIILFTN